MKSNKLINTTGAFFLHIVVVCILLFPNSTQAAKSRKSNLTSLNFVGGKTSFMQNDWETYDLKNQDVTGVQLFFGDLIFIEYLNSSKSKTVKHTLENFFGDFNSIKVSATSNISELNFGASVHPKTMIRPYIRPGIGITNVQMKINTSACGQVYYAEQNHDHCISLKEEDNSSTSINISVGIGIALVTKKFTLGFEGRATTTSAAWLGRAYNGNTIQRLGFIGFRW